MKTGATVNTGEVYEAYQRFCRRVGLRPLAGRAFGDLLAELDMYAFLHARVQSRGRYGRTREIQLDLPDQLVSKIYDTILLSFDAAK